MVEPTKKSILARGWGRRWSPAVGALLIVTAGCESVFEVNNPNQLVQEDLETPAAATALVNGAETTVARAVGRITLPAAAATDELTWAGSYDSGRELEAGFMRNPSNEFTDNEGWGWISEGRFMADEAIRLVSGHDEAGNLRDRNLLARAYLYGATIYGMIADHYEDFVLSDRKTPAPPVGEANMSKLHDTAIDYATKGIAVAQATGNTTLRGQLLAVRAKVHHGKAVRASLAGNRIPAQPLLDVAAANQDAAAALGTLSGDWKFQFQYSPVTSASHIGAWINSRQEFRVSNVYGVPHSNGKRITAARLLDPITGEVDVALEKELTSMGALAATTQLYPPFTVVSAREMRLILAEAALAQGNTAEFTTQINAIRELDGVTPYSGQIAARDMLVHARRTNLFLQGRRLHDLYRFGLRSPTWVANSEAVTRPGSFFPIAQRERISNCHIAGGC